MLDNKVKVGLGTKTVVGLVDTGAMINVIKKEIVTGDPELARLPVTHPDKSHIRSANGSLVKIEGKIKTGLAFHFHGKTVKVFTELYVVENVTHDLIIGQPFLKENRCNIDIEKQKLKIKPLVKIRAVENFTVPTESALNVIASLDSSLPDGTVGVSESITDIHSIGLGAAQAS